MKRDRVRLVCVALVAVLGLSGTAAAQQPELGAKIGINVSQVGGVADYYATQLRPANPIDDRSGVGLIVGGFVIVPIKGRFGLQADVLFSQRRHRVNVPPTALCRSCALRATFTREYVDVAVLPRFDLATVRGKGLYLIAGPGFSFKTGADFGTDDPNQYRDIYYVTTLPYGTPALLKRNQASIVVGGGVVVRRLSVEVRLTRGLQPIFKDGAGILDALVQVGGYRPNLEQYYLPQVAPILERAKSKDLSLLLGVRF